MPKHTPNVSSARSEGASRRLQDATNYHLRSKTYSTLSRRRTQPYAVVNTRGAAWPEKTASTAS
eukprot:4728446-Pyramimonas_sp.AAC.1